MTTKNLFEKSKLFYKNSFDRITPLLPVDGIKWTNCKNPFTVPDILRRSGEFIAPNRYVLKYKDHVFLLYYKNYKLCGEELFTDDY